MTDDEKQHLNVLLKEYDTLRQEVLNRMNSRSQFTAVLGVVGAFSAAALTAKNSGTGKNGEPPPGGFAVVFVIITVLGIVLGFYYWRTAVLVARIGRHLAQLEIKINQLCGKELMTWEHKVSARNPIHRLFGERVDKAPE